MTKRLILFVIIFLFCKVGFAKHITGGEMFYEFVSEDATTKTYNITLRLFRDDFTVNGAAMPSVVTIGIFDNDNGSKIVGSGSNSDWDIDISNGDGGEPVPLNALPPCIVNAPTLAYHMGLYTFTVTLRKNLNGYTAVYQTCCRVDGIANVGNSIGSSYPCLIPGSNQLQTGNDNSPKFSTGISIICQNKPFTLNFSATDVDGDSLVYTLCDAYNGGLATNASFNDPAAPPYTFVPYTPPFSGNSPLGNLATINTTSGIISGIAPATGKYVVCVCVESYRGGKRISTHRKDFIITVSDCSFSGASIEPVPINCSDFHVIFQNFANNPVGTSFHWDFGVTSLTNDTSNLENTNYTYPDTGVYNVKLIVILPGGSCIDSNTISVKVFPGFFPKISIAGQCHNTPIQFTDLTTTLYGTVNSWFWDFGDISSGTDTSIIKNPTHTYINANSYNVHFAVTSSKGCNSVIDTTILISDKPSLIVPNDTVICFIDSLQLIAVGTGTFLWSPNYKISNVNIFNPFVNPTVSTSYYVKLTDPFGCVGTDSVHVKVVNFVTQKITPDTSICKTDAILLQLNSNALSYQWTEIPAGNTLSNYTIKNPIATPLTKTTYYVVGSIGSCKATDSITVKVSPYPNANAGLDQQICLGNSVQLNASGGTFYSWSPPAFLNNRFIPNPLSVHPTGNIQYIVTVGDTLGCPKKVNDTVFISVQTVKANAGTKDTSVVLNQPLQLNASGGSNYLWSPNQWLNNNAIPNPIALPQTNIVYTVNVSNNIGCTDIDSIRVTLYLIDPSIYVPNAFTPNGDGINDKFKPIIIGMKSLDIFRIYNRWGQMVYSSNDIKGGGWDGTFNSKPQDAATFIWYAEGTDYRDQKIKKKGYVILIR